MGRAALKSKQILLLIPSIAVIGAGVFFLTDNKTTAPSQSAPAQNQTVSEQNQPIAYEGETGKSALELLKAKYTATTKQSSYGEFVTSIDGKEGNGPKYWAFYLNGKLADVGAGAYNSKNGDKIEWRLE